MNHEFHEPQCELASSTQFHEVGVCIGREFTLDLMQHISASAWIFNCCTSTMGKKATDKKKLTPEQQAQYEDVLKSLTKQKVLEPAAEEPTAKRARKAEEKETPATKEPARKEAPKEPKAKAKRGPKPKQVAKEPQEPEDPVAKEPEAKETVGTKRGAPKGAAKGKAKAKAAKTTKESAEDNIEEFWDNELMVNVSWANFANVYTKVKAAYPIENHDDVVQGLTEALGPCPAELLPAVQAVKDQTLAAKETQKDPDEEEHEKEEDEEAPVDLRPGVCDEDDHDDDQDDEQEEAEEDEDEDEEEFPETLKDPAPNKRSVSEAPQVKTKAPEEQVLLARTLTDATTLVLGEAGRMCAF